jgi:hypothetical protein
MSGRDDSFGWRPPRRRDIRDTFGKRRPPEYGRASRPPRPSWPSRQPSTTPVSSSLPSRSPEAVSTWWNPQGSRPVREPLRSDDVVRHARHGIGVVIATGTVDCQVRFYGGKAWLKPARLLTILPASGAQAFLTHVLATGKAKPPELRGAALWLRSADVSIMAIALEIFSRTREPRTVAMIEEAVSGCGAGKRLQIADKLSAVRTRLGLPSWPDTVRAVPKPTEADRAAEAAAAKAAATAAKIAKLQADREEAVLRQLRILDAIRARLGEQHLTAEQRATIRNAVLAKLDSPDEYRNTCWHCGTPVHSRFNPHCPTCSWLSCICGACRKPNYPDAKGLGQPACPREARLLAS